MADDMIGDVKEIARSGHIGGYNLFILDEAVVVLEDRPNGKRFRHEVPNFGTAIGELMARPGARIAMTRFDHMDIIHLYDEQDHNFGYGLNVHARDLSEWGFAPDPNAMREFLKERGENSWSDYR